MRRMEFASCQPWTRLDPLYTSFVFGLCWVRDRHLVSRRTEVISTAIVQ